MGESGNVERIGPIQIVVTLLFSRFKDLRNGNSKMPLLNNFDAAVHYWRRKRTFFRLFVTVTQILTFIYLYWFINGKLEIRTKIIIWSKENVKPDSRRIFFTAARGRSPLAMMRQSCAVESTARYNPDRPIQLFISADDQDGIGQPLSYSTDPWLSITDQFENVVIVLYNETEYFEGTPLEPWYKEGVWRKSPYKHVHYSDYMRFLTAYRGGGMYMDADFITTKRIDERILWNFAATQNDEHTQICSCIFHLEHGHRLLEPMMTHLSSIEYTPEAYATFFDDFLFGDCGFREYDLVSRRCLDVKLLSRHYFFPIVWPEWERYFRETADNQTMEQVERAYSVHVWNHMSTGKRSMNSTSKHLFANLSRKHCPLTFAMNFGITNKNSKRSSLTL